MRNCTRLLLLPLLLIAGGCEITKTENPLSPSVAGPIPGVEISAPKLLQPESGAQIPGDSQPITLLIENSYSTGQRPLNYSFEVATDAGFSNMVFLREGITPGENGRTALTLPNALGTGRGYYWRAKAQDGANTGPYSGSVGFNVFTPVSFGKPAPVSPIGGQTATGLAPEFRFVNASRTGNPSLVSYVIEVSTNSAFAGIIAAWQFPEQAGETKFTAPTGLPSGMTIYWRVRAFEGGIIGPWSDIGSFKTPVVTTGGGSTGGGTTGAACSNSTQLGIVTCRRNQYTGSMNTDQILTFLRNVASDLNRVGTWGKGYGLLRKTSGNQCGGYSCDIICQVGGSEIYDVLSDVEGAQSPTWGAKPPSSSQCDVQ